MASEAVKRKLPTSSESPEAHQAKKHQGGDQAQPPNLPGDLCGYCNKKCTTRGKTSEAIQCDFCCVWVHAHCEEVSRDQYKNLNQLFSDIPNIAYYCKLNHCYSRQKQLNSTLLKSSSSVSATSCDENVINTLLNQHQKLSSSCEQLTCKINDLCSQNSTLQNQFNNLTKNFDKGPSLTNASSFLAVNVIDEYADRDRRKCNLIVFNTPESIDTGGGTDTENFVTLCKSALNYDVKPTKVLRLGKKGVKPRPLLVALESEEIKKHILMHARHLRTSEQYKGIFISSDMTKSEREQHKVLRAELQQRKSQGETNLVIRNGQIIVRRPLLTPPLGTGTSGMQTDQHT